MADKENLLDFDVQNAAAMAEILADPVTSEAVRLQIINEILADSKSESFFETMFQEEMSLSKCAFCNHENHWLVPEDEKNIMGRVTYEKDKRVPKQPTKDECTDFQEACQKKMVTT